jgi:hypothetical protein
MLLFVIAYHTPAEFERFQFILDHWTELVDMQSPFSFLFVDSIGRKLNAAYEHRTLTYKDPPDLKHFQCVSREWAFVAKHIADEIDCEQWFWWEQDVLPVRKDCFDFFLRFWTGSCRIMGYHVKDNMWGMRHKINGAAFYARNYWRYVEPHFDLSGTFDTRTAFDAKTQAGAFVELNRWYGLCHHEGALRLTPSLRLVHGIKDDSLIRQVLCGESTYPSLPGKGGFRFCGGRVLEAVAEAEGQGVLGEVNPLIRVKHRSAPRSACARRPRRLRTRRRC